MNPMLNRLHRDERGMSLVFVGHGLHGIPGGDDPGHRRGDVHDGAQPGADGSRCRRHWPGRWRSRSTTTTNRSSAARPCRARWRQRARTGHGAGREHRARRRDVSTRRRRASNNRVRVAVHRTRGAAGNAGGDAAWAAYFGVMRVDITATATAEASPTATRCQCVKPFIDSRQVDRAADGRGMRRHGSTCTTTTTTCSPIRTSTGPATSPSYTGYNAMRDKGMR